MNRQEKIESICRGKAVIKNDMRGDLRLLSVMNECDGDWNWTYEGSTKAGFYGVNIRGKFNSFDALFKDQLHNRPQILMSELVEAQTIKARKFIITAEMRDLENQVHKGEISYSRMIEILCEKAEKYHELKLISTEQ